MKTTEELHAEAIRECVRVHGTAIDNDSFLLGYVLGAYDQLRWEYEQLQQVVANLREQREFYADEYQGPEADYHLAKSSLYDMTDLPF